MKIALLFGNDPERVTYKYVANGTVRGLSIDAKSNVISALLSLACARAAEALLGQGDIGTDYSPA